MMPPGVTAFQFAVAALLTGQFLRLMLPISLLESSIVGYWLVY